MTVSTFVFPDSNAQAAASYPGILDGAVSVLTRLGVNFAPHEDNPSDMAISLDPGHLLVGGNLIEVTAQTATPFVAPTTNPRIDRVVVDRATGVASVVQGVEAPSPVPPAIPAGAFPVAQVRLQTTTTGITNAAITDERDFSGSGTSAGGLLNIQTFTSSGTYTPTSGTTKIIVEMVGGGGSAGGTGATNASQGAASGGGAAGAYAKALITSGFAGAAVTVGSGGAAPAAGGNNGNAGSASSFGSLVTASGANGGHAGTAFAPPAVIGGGGATPPPTGANIVGGIGEQGNDGFILSVGAVAGGAGGSSHFGGGGNSGGNGPGASATSPGGGGGGSSSILNTAARSGGAGGNGIVIVYEYA